MDSLSPYIFFPYTFHPTRATGHSEITNDNIFFNYVSKEAICGYLTSTIYDHLPQILFIPSIFQTVLLQNSTYLKETVQISIKLNLSWITLNNIGVTSWIINMVISMYQWKILLMIWVVYLITMHPFKKISKYKFKITTKSWITVAFQK